MLAPDLDPEDETLLIITRTNRMNMISCVKWKEILRFLVDHPKYRKAFVPRHLPNYEDLPAEVSPRDAVRLAQILQTDEFLQDLDPETRQQVHKLSEMMRDSDGFTLAVNSLLQLAFAIQPQFFFEHGQRVCDELVHLIQIDRYK